MTNARITLILAALLACGLTSVGSAAPEYDQTFLTDYSKLVATPVPNNMGTDLVYLPPGALDRIARFPGCRRSSTALSASGAESTSW